LLVNYFQFIKTICSLNAFLLLLNMWLKTEHRDSRVGAVFQCSLPPHPHWIRIPQSGKRDACLGDSPQLCERAWFDCTWAWFKLRERMCKSCV